MKVVGEDEDAYIFRDTTPDYFEFKIALDIITNNKKQENKKPKQELTITNNPGKDHTIKTYNNKEAIKIFNIKGQEIKTINPRNQKQIYWDGTDNNGKQTTKGIYIATQGNKTIGKIIELPEKTTQPTKTNTTNTTKINEKKTETIEREVSITLIPDSVYLIYHDTIMLKDTDNDFIPDIHLDSIPQTQDVTFKLRDGYTRKDLGGNGLKIITHAIPPPIAGDYYEFYTRFYHDIHVISGDSIIDTIDVDEYRADTAYFDTNGIATIKDLPANTTLFLEYGGYEKYYAKRGDFWNLKKQINFTKDTIAADTVKLVLFPKRLIIPGDTRIIDTARARYIKMIRGPPTDANTEEAMGRPVYLNLDPGWTESDKEAFKKMLKKCDSLFYGEEPSPWVITSEPRNKDTIDEIIPKYDHVNNYYPGKLGWNLRDGPGYTTPYGYMYKTHLTNKENEERLSEYNMMAGEITVHPGNLPEIAKELYGRRSNFSNVTDWKSFMNDSDDNDGVPTLIDRAVYHLRQVSQKNRYYYKISYYGEEQTIDNL
jgi:hypothetical protein